MGALTQMWGGVQKAQWMLMVIFTHIMLWTFYRVEQDPCTFAILLESSACRRGGRQLDTPMRRAMQGKFRELWKHG